MFCSATKFSESSEGDDFKWLIHLHTKYSNSSDGKYMMTIVFSIYQGHTNPTHTPSHSSPSTDAHSRGKNHNHKELHHKNATLALSWRTLLSTTFLTLASIPHSRHHPNEINWPTATVSTHPHPITSTQGLESYLGLLFSLKLFLVFITGSLFLGLSLGAWCSYRYVAVLGFESPLPGLSFPRFDAL